jgi:hypothetical protein
MDKHYKEIENLLLERGCTIIEITKKCNPMKYICKCGTERTQLFKDFKRRNCRNCNIQIIETVDDIKEDDIIENDGEIWKRIPGGWISSKGRAKNNLGKLLTLCESKYRYHINKKHEYASRLVAVAFKVLNYEKLDTQSWCVNHYDKNPGNNYLENLYISSKDGTKKETKNIIRPAREVDVENIDYVFLPEISDHHLFYRNGEVFDGKNFLKFSISKDPGKDGKEYYRLNGINSTDISYKVNRIICYAFNPLPGFCTLKDYAHLKANHKNGNTLDNNSSNLEWVTHSGNMQHAYDTKLIKKTRYVLQHDKDTNEMLNEYHSIAEASRQSGDCENYIRDMCQGKNKVYRNNLFKWTFKFPEDSTEYTKKYSRS